MQFEWKDYTTEYSAVIESWLDPEARKFTGCDEGFDQYFEYWKNESNTKLGENFWAKVICQGNIPFAVITLGLYNGEFTVSEFIADPLKRGQGLGSSALTELIASGKKIIGQEIFAAQAVIYPSNTASQRTFEKAGFTFDHAHKDGDAWYYSCRKNDFII